MARPLAVVLLLARPTSSDAVDQLLEDAAGLAGRGHRVIVASPRDAEIARRCAEAGITWLRLAQRHPLDLAAMRRLALLARQRESDLVHAADRLSLVVALGASRLWSSFALVATRSVSFRLGAVTAALLRSRRLSRVVASCEHVRQVLLAGGVAPPRIEVVFEGVDPDRLDPARFDPAAVRSSLGVPLTAPLVGHLGTRDWEGWKELLAAFPSVRASHPEARVLLIGCGSRSQCAGVAQLARELGLAEAVITVPARPDVRGVLAACDVVVDPSWAGTGVSAAARVAMALARPVVATTVGGNGELLEDGASGLLVPPRDIPTLAAAMARLLGDVELARRLGRAGRERVRDRFSQRMRVDRLEALYRRVVAERAAPRA